MLFIKSPGPNGATKQDEYPAETAMTNKPSNSSTVNQGIRLTIELLKSHCFLGLINVGSHKKIMFPSSKAYLLYSNSFK